MITQKQLALVSITYNKGNPYHYDIFSKYWPQMGRSSDTRDISNKEIMEPSSLKDILVKV